MYKYLVILPILLLLTSCVQVQPHITPRMNSFSNVPVEVDIFGDPVTGVLAPTVLPNASVTALYNKPPYTGTGTSLTDQTPPPGIYITSYRVQFAYENSGINNLPLTGYVANTDLYIKANETYSFPLTFFEGQQWNEAVTVFLANGYNTYFATICTVTFEGHDTLGNEFELEGSFVAHFGEYAG